MAVKNRRRRYFVHPSCQLRYIAFSILPALIVSLFCTSLLLYTGESILKDIGVHWAQGYLYGPPKLATTGTG